MRLTPAEIQTIKSVIRSVDVGASVYLFGSRTRDDGAGGDIDLLVESRKIQLSDKISILAEIKATLGEQKIDIIVSQDVAHDIDPFIQSIRREICKL